MLKSLLISVLLLQPFLMLSRQQKVTSEAGWTSKFGFDQDELTTVGHNPYFILEPGYTLVLETGNEQLIITVLDKTKKIDNVETRIVEERETKSGHLVEVSRNYFAISRRTNSVFYFGEDVDVYKSNKIVSHEGSWQAGRHGSRAGLMMPGTPLLRARYYQEFAPGVAMDRAEIQSLREVLATPAGKFSGV